jgi:PAT family beta-lactamase induction signal transducer AmpG
LAIACFSFFPVAWKENFAVYGFVLIYYILYTFITITLYAIAMQLSWKTVAATQFTLYMALSNMGRASGSGLLGPLKNSMSWQYVFLFIALIPLVMVILIQFINFSKHKTAIDKF